MSHEFRGGANDAVGCVGFGEDDWMALMSLQLGPS